MASSDSGQQLLLAARKGRINSMKTLLAAGADIQAVNDGGDNALTLAAREAHPRMVRLLLERGARFDSRAADNRRAFPLSKLDENSTLMAQYIHSESDPTWEPWSTIKKPTRLRVQRTRKLLLTVTELLIAAGADINATDEHGCTPLHNFISAALNDCVKLLLRQSSLLNVVNRYGDTPLSTAISWHQEHEIALLLLEAGADPNAGDDKPLHLVAGPFRSVSLLHSIIAAGADINARNRLGQTALHCACGCREANDEIIRLLLHYGADMKLTDNEGFLPSDHAMMAFLKEKTAQGCSFDELVQPPDCAVRFSPDHARLLLAAMRGDVKILTSVLKEGVPDAIKTLALHEAIKSGCHDCCRILLENGVRPNGRDIQTYPPLLTAASNLDVAAAVLLLEYGADPEYGNSYGQKPLYMVCQAGMSQFYVIDAPEAKRLQLAKLLLDHGADVNGSCDNGFTPLRQAVVAARDVDLARLLLQHGARPDATDEYGRAVFDYVTSSGTKMREFFHEVSIIT